MLSLSRMAADPKKTTPLEKVRALEVGKLNAEHEPEGWVMVSVPERGLRFVPRFTCYITNCPMQSRETVRSHIS